MSKKGNSIRPQGFPKRYSARLEMLFGSYDHVRVRERLAAHTRRRDAFVALTPQQVIAVVSAEAAVAKRAGIVWPVGAETARVPVDVAVEELRLSTDAAKAFSDIGRDGKIELWMVARLTVERNTSSAVLRVRDEIIAQAERKKARLAAKVEAEHVKAAARVELLDAVGDEMGPVPVWVLGQLLGSSKLSDLASHPNCGALTLQVSFTDALADLVSVRLAKRSTSDVEKTRIPQAVPVSITAKASKMPAYVVVDLTEMPAGPSGLAVSTIPHAEHDRIVAAAADPAWRRAACAEARKRRDETAEARRAKRDAEAAEAAAIAETLGLDRSRENLNTTDAAKALGISTRSVRSAIERGDLLGHQVEGNMGYGAQNFWRVPARDIAALVTTETPPAWLTRARKAWAASPTRLRVDETTALRAAETERYKSNKERQAADMAAARAAVRAKVTVRRIAPDTVVFHVGPTNSGKTHDALDALVKAGRGTYAAPLRMLAGEAFERLSARLGEGQVGLVTGEERICDDAPILCCTAEMAPMSGELLVLDEVHWADDPERGWAWTRLLLTAQYRHIHIAGAPDSLPLVRKAFPDVKVVSHERLCPLEISTKPVRLAETPDRAAVIAFSRKAVYHIAGLLKASGRRPAVLYGAMPPGARRAEIASFIAGEADVIVATDVIGHGINLPVSAVLFAETVKFDGTTRRNLAAWEVAQIAGRAGRYGYEDAGRAGTLSGVTGLSAAADVVAKAAVAKVDVGDGLAGYRRVEQGRLAPSLDDLAATEACQLPARLKAWSEAAGAVAKQVDWIRPASVSDLLGRLNVIARSSGLEALDVEAAWRLARSPLDADDPVDADVLARIAHAVAGNAKLASLIAGKPDGTLEALEAAGRRSAALRWFSLAFPNAGGITHDEVVAYETAVTNAIVARLRDAIAAGVAHCGDCGRICAPWSSWCNTCYRDRRGYHGGGGWRYDDGSYEDWDYEHEYVKGSG